MGLKMNTITKKRARIVSAGFISCILLLILYGVDRLLVWKFPGFINKCGEMVIEPKYQYASDFHNGVALVGFEYESNRVGVLYGCIDTKGKLIHEMNLKYEFATKSNGDPYDSTFYGAHSDKCFFSRRSAQANAIPEYQFPTNRFDVRFRRIGYKFGIWDKKGKWLVTPNYDSIGGRHGFYQVEQNGKYGIIDFNGKLILKPTCYELGEFSDGLARCYVEKHFGYLDMLFKGKML
jgi:hypothetical protein